MRWFKVLTFHSTTTDSWDTGVLLWIVMGRITFWFLLGLTLFAVSSQGRWKIYIINLNKIKIKKHNKLNKKIKLKYKINYN